MGGGGGGRGGLVSRTKIHKICSCKEDIERYNKTSRILKLIKSFCQKTEIQVYLHWIAHMIEISAFCQSRCHIWPPRRLSEHISSASFGNFILTRRLIWSRFLKILKKIRRNTSLFEDSDNHFKCM